MGTNYVQQHTKRVNSLLTEIRKTARENITRNFF